jgi:hypothetical protein
MALETPAALVKDAHLIACILECGAAAPLLECRPKAPEHWRTPKRERMDERRV